ncbi:hypothetical protein ALC62_10170 [Cyphomyrmex costatus]|uniref:Lipoprotein n=1 Tax=Cyphomyrmex costatus TaxID=456900 RepID=A0A195CFG5_9HYME|nr:hypothetical protein ALC62_10170 [Cyphomyrmex costatus]
MLFAVALSLNLPGCSLGDKPTGCFDAASGTFVKCD